MSTAGWVKKVLLSNIYQTFGFSYQYNVVIYNLFLKKLLLIIPIFSSVLKPPLL